MTLTEEPHKDTESRRPDLPVLQNYDYYDVNSAVFKISDRCNLGCRYCYREKAQHNAGKDMPLSVVDTALSSLLEYKTDLYERTGIRKTPSMQFIWHGGEPMIVGIDRFREILAIQRRYIDGGFSLNNIIQTNGTLINDAFADLFKEYGFRVGVSLDGPGSIHDIHRTFRNGRSSFDKTYEGIGVLKEHKIPWSAISVINHEYVGREEEIYSFFKEEEPTEVDFTPSFFYDSDLTLTPDEYASFMNRLFDLWIEDEIPYEIRFFKDVMYKMGYRRMPGKTSIICELTGMCHRNISIGSDGDLYTCECLNSLERNLVGNIMKESFRDIVRGERFRRLAESTNRYSEECVVCEEFPICKAGCYNRRLPAEDGLPRLDYYCRARKSIMHHIREVCDGLV